MPLKFSNTPQLVYGDAPRMGDKSGTAGNFYSRLHPTARPISTAPSYAVQVFDRDGKSAWAHFRRNAWQELKNYPDWKTGAANWRETGNTVDAIAWSSAPKV